MNKRIAVLILSFGSIIGYGYALGGLGGYLVGQGRPWVIAAGLAGGTVAAGAALAVWRKYLDELEREREERTAELNRYDNYDNFYRDS